MNRKDRRAAQKNKSSDKTSSDIPLMASPADQQKALLIKQALQSAADLMALEKIDDAKNIYESLIPHAPHNHHIFVNLGLIAAHYTQDLKEAERLFDIAVNLHPTADLYARRASFHRECGHLAKADADLKSALAYDPDHIPSLYDLSFTKTYIDTDDPDFQTLLKQKDRLDHLDDELQIKTHFALGKALSDIKNYNASFSHYAQGNNLQNKLFSYDPQSMTDYMDNITHIFTPALVEKFKQAGSTSKRPIFIVGLPRSGTTLTEQILSAHPDVFGAGELSYFPQSVPVLPNPDLPTGFNPHEASLHNGFIQQLTPDTLNQIAEHYLDKIKTINDDAPYLVDKMPFNFLWAGLIRLCFPQAKIIHCCRAPMDTGLSIYRQLFSQNIPWAYDLENIGHYYLAYRHLMSHWHNIGIHMYDIHYENLIHDTKDEIHRLLNFCDLSWHSNCLEFYKNKRQVKTASVAQVRQPIYTKSVSGWRKFQDQLRPLLNIIGE